MFCFYEQLPFVCFDKYVHDFLRSRANISATSELFSVCKAVQVLNEETVFLIDFCPFLNLSVTDRILGISIGGRRHTMSNGANFSR